jgi:acetylglutamate/LysW-gamma-L-alpha-aminoadipate kinase
VIIVHGANALRDQLAQKLGIEKKILTSLSGYSSVFSDKGAIDLLMMAYAGLRNKRLVELCQQHGINAIGLSGLDGRMIQGMRNKGIRVKEGSKLRIIRDQSGKARSINEELLNYLLEHNYLPVITVPIVDESGFAINSENDDIVSALQKTVQADHVIQLIEAPGLLKSSGDETTLVGILNHNELPAWENEVEGRMKRKILALRKLFEYGVNKVTLADGRIEHPLEHALSGKGTIIS